MQDKSKKSVDFYSITLIGKQRVGRYRVYYDLNRETYGERWVVVQKAEVESVEMSCWTCSESDDSD